ADGEVGPPCRQRAQLQKRRVLVDQQLDAFPGEQLAPFPVAFDVLLAAARDGLGVLGGQLVELGQHRVAVGRELVAAGVDAGGQNGHAEYPSSFPASCSMISLVPPPMPMMRMSRNWRSTSLSRMYPIPPCSCTASLATHWPASTAVFCANATWTSTFSPAA